MFRAAGVMLWGVFLLAAGRAGASEVLVLAPVQDATLIQHPDGALANGAGPVLFAGRTSQAFNGVRRGLIAFDVSGALPAAALIESVSLRLFMTPSNPAPRVYRLHRVLAPWSEGAAWASGGGGAPAGPGDVTWIHTTWDAEFWAHPGGQFRARESARLQVGDSGFYTWSDAPHLLQDVRLWNRAPGRNFGWLLVGDEAEAQTSKSFASREHPDAALRPLLVITYSLPGPPPRP